MRANRVHARSCAGNAEPYEKFEAWAKTVPYTLRNPLYHWTHLELKNYFGITKLLNESTAKEIYDECSAKLQQEDFRVQALLTKMNVQIVCTTDDPTDSLEYHIQFAKQNSGFKMYPSFRPDKSYTTDDPGAYNNYLDLLANVSATAIHSFDDLISALKKRMKLFNELGCRSSDHGPESLFFDANALMAAPQIFKKIRDRIKLSVDERQLLRCAILIELCKLYHEFGWAQQFHLGALRGNNSRMAREVGADSGFDSIGEFPQAVHLSKFFNHLDDSSQLTR